MCDSHVLYMLTALIIITVMHPTMFTTVSVTTNIRGLVLINAAVVQTLLAVNVIQYFHLLYYES